MIIYNYIRIEDFLARLDRRAGNDIFTQYIEPKSASDLSPSPHKLILQFLGYIDPQNTSITMLHQCTIELKNKTERIGIMASIKKAFDKVEPIKLVEGFINEIFLSIS